MRVLPLLVHPTDRIKPSTFFSPPQCVQQCSEAKAIWESQPPLRGRCTNTSIVLQQKSLPLVVTPCVTVLATKLCTNTTRHEFRPVELLTQRAQQTGQSQILSIVSMCVLLPHKHEQQQKVRLPITNEFSTQQPHHYVIPHIEDHICSQTPKYYQGNCDIPLSLFETFRCW